MIKIDAVPFAENGGCGVFLTAFGWLHSMVQASMLLDRAVALSPDRPISKSAAQGEGGRTAAEVNTEGTKTSLRAARLRRSASQLLEQLNKAMEEA